MRTLIRAAVLISGLLSIAGVQAQIPTTVNFFVDVDGDEQDEFFDLDQIFSGPGTVAIQGSESEGVFGTQDPSEFFPITYAYNNSADMDSGQIRLDVMFDNYGADSLSSDPAFAVLSSQGVLQDTLQFTSATADPFDVTFNLDVDGSVSNSANIAGNIDAFLRAGIDTGSLDLSANGMYDEVLSVTTTLSGLVNDVDLFTSVSLSYFGIGVGATIEAQFGNTAVLSIEFPDDVTVTSENNILGTSTTVPAPGAAWLLWSSMLGLVGLRRALSLQHRSGCDCTD